MPGTQLWDNSPIQKRNESQKLHCSCGSGHTGTCSWAWWPELPPFWEQRIGSHKLTSDLHTCGHTQKIIFKTQLNKYHYNIHFTDSTTETWKCQVTSVGLLWSSWLLSPLSANSLNKTLTPKSQTYQAQKPSSPELWTESELQVSHEDVSYTQHLLAPVTS